MSIAKGIIRNDFFRTGEYVSSSSGTADAGKPVVLDSGGNIDPSVVTGGGAIGGSIEYAKSSNATLSVVEMQGGTIIVSSNATMTLQPVSSVDYSLFCVYVAGSYTVNIDPNASDRIVLDNTALDDGDKVVSSGTTGDYIVLKKDSANGFVTLGRSGTWTDGGV